MQLTTEMSRLRTVISGAIMVSYIVVCAGATFAQGQDTFTEEEQFQQMLDQTVTEQRVARAGEVRQHRAIRDASGNRGIVYQRDMAGGQEWKRDPSLKEWEQQIPSPEALTPAQVRGDTQYTLGFGDVVSISVRGQPEFSGQFGIGPDGYIQYTYVGDIKADGISKTELGEVIAEKLTRFVKVPDVTVAITGYFSKNIYVMGDVANPSKYAMQGDTIKLREALLMAGLPTYTARARKVHVIHPDFNNPSVKVVNADDILFRGILEENVDLRPGDLVYVPSRTLALINRKLSEILSPFVTGIRAIDVYDDVSDD